MGRMKSHRHNGAVIPGSTLTMRELEAPANNGYFFLGGSGWLGLQCACGYVVTARSAAACEAALREHQSPDVCPSYHDFVPKDDEEQLQT